MNWNNFSEFCAMGGYALYVWGSMAVVALCIAIEVLVLRQRQAGARALPLAMQPQRQAAASRSSHGVQDEAAA
jgi:heme exporter protein D